MFEHREIPTKEILDAIANSSGQSVAVVDSQNAEIYTSNNNSICTSLNPGGKLINECAAYCGNALAEANELEGRASYVCHAGLECRAASLSHNGRPVAVIVGRSFVAADNYRKATERAISGDWQDYAPGELFENVLLSSTTAEVDAALEEVEAESTEIKDAIEAAPVQAAADEARELEEQTAGEQQSGPESSIDEKGALPEISDAAHDELEPLALRSFFSSILQKNYADAVQAFLELIAASYALDSLVWFERRDDRMISSAAVGPLQGHRIILGMPVDDPRLSDAVAAEMPVVLTEPAETSAAAERSMYVFPSPVGRDLPAVLAIDGPGENARMLHQISRLCIAAGPQLEILRLRREVRNRSLLADSVRRFSGDFADQETDNSWLHVTQVAAELMQAERCSLLLLDEEQDALTIKAAIGISADMSGDPDPGHRVSRTVLQRGRATAVTDVSSSGLAPAPTERGYKTASFLSSPISLGGRNIAVMNFTDKASGDAFGRSDLELFEQIAPHVGASIERAMLKDRAGQFQQLSVTDALTGLLNRRYMDERLIEEVKRSNRHGYPTSFVMLDVDHFKSYNDEFGHPAGDQALKLVGQVLRDTLRGADVAARYGGEEFAVLLPQTTADEAAVIAERLRSNVEAATFPHRAVTISLGVATCSSENCTTEGLVLEADNALYLAKNGGRNRVHSHGDIEPDVTGRK